MSGTCEVSIGGDYDGDVAAVYNDRTVKARKAHKCYECGEQIPVGAEHRCVTGLWDGKWETYRWCAACQEVAAEFSEGARTFGILWEEMETNWDEGAHLQACLNRLSTAAAKAHMVRRWRKWKELDA